MSLYPSFLTHLYAAFMAGILTVVFIFIPFFGLIIGGLLLIGSIGNLILSFYYLFNFITHRRNSWECTKCKYKC